MAKPIYQKIIDELKIMIKEPRYSNGQIPIPNEIALAKDFQVSRETIRKAIMQLVNDGYLYRKKRVGTTVNTEKIKVSTNLTSWSTYHIEKQYKNKPVQMFAKKITIEPIRNSFINLFHAQANEQCVMLERVMGSEGIEVYFQSFFNPAFNVFLSKEFLNCKWNSLYDFIESKGIRLNKSEEIIKSTRINKQIAKQLKITDLTTPILKRERKIYDINDNLIEINIGYYNGDKVQYELLIKKE